jgi:hypothetical protein
MVVHRLLKSVLIQPTCLYIYWMILTTSQVCALTSKASSPCLLPPWSQRILCIGRTLLTISVFLIRRRIALLLAGRLFNRHIFVVITAEFRRGRSIVLVRGRHDISYTGTTRSLARMLLCSTVGRVCARLVLRAAVSSALLNYTQHNGSANVSAAARIAAFQRRVSW